MYIIGRLMRLNHKGFTLVEVMVGILITVTFVGAAMQALVVASLFKVRAQEYSEATTWIQEDLELVRFEASQLPADNNNCNDYGKTLDNALPDVEDRTPEDPNSNRASSLGSRPYVLDRDPNPNDDILEINYAVVRANENTAPVATLYAEVIPDASFACN
ncbi:prepilin-type N-terminal cleavage/methylation domain-containing protein [Synechococcales cyanobacterium C]|uniref:Prepilin-type N-terminal cleavage/methylation domain-containing protein n=2 Tax=Petrachloros TaxID=2918834 RepID=A0A8K1ZZ29_9CYAN|nr:prepilin-type N-terminal cleavage/methylation domain-containing protein [Petrachloros mirabilis ULC683]